MDGVSELALATHFDGDLPADAATEESGWIERARKGDIEAFDAIMLHYENRLLRFLIGLVGDTEVARELCQDTFFSAFRALPRTQGELKLSAWLHTIALNNARSHHRRRRFRFLLPIEDHDVVDERDDLQNTVEVQDTVQRALARLPRQYAEPLLMQLTSGLSCREIAEALRCSEGAVKVRLLRAREAFKRAYREELTG